LTKEADPLYYLYCRSREWISMAIIASAIFGRSAFTFGRIRIIRFISSEERCPLNMIYKHALAFVFAEGLMLSGAILGALIGLGRGGLLILLCAATGHWK